MRTAPPKPPSPGALASGRPRWGWVPGPSPKQGGDPCAPPKPRAWRDGLGGPSSPFVPVSGLCEPMKVQPENKSPLSRALNPDPLTCQQRKQPGRGQGGALPFPCQRPWSHAPVPAQAPPKGPAAGPTRRTAECHRSGLRCAVTRLELRAAQGLSAAQSPGVARGGGQALGPPPSREPRQFLKQSGASTGWSRGLSISHPPREHGRSPELSRACRPPGPRREGRPLQPGQRWADPVDFEE